MPEAAAKSIVFTDHAHSRCREYRLRVRDVLGIIASGLRVESSGKRRTLEGGPIPVYLPTLHRTVRLRVQVLVADEVDRLAVVSVWPVISKHRVQQLRRYRRRKENS